MPRLATGLLAFAAALVADSEALANGRNADKDLIPYFELKPFEVVGEDIPITVYARSNRDRHYATKLAHKVVETVYETMERSPGSGLVIMGNSGEPHPLHLLRRFSELSREDGASAEVAQLGIELEAQLTQWRDSFDFDFGSDGDNKNEGEELELNEDVLIKAVPLPLMGIAAELYLLAWEAQFDATQVDQRLRALTAAELADSRLAEFDWVFYLPPRNALNQVLKEVLPKVLEAEEIGLFKRVMIRSALVAFKPVIRDAMEGVRKGVMYWAVLSATSGYGQGDIKALAGAYIRSQMPQGRVIPGDKLERGLEAIREQKQANAEYAKDPYIAPEPLAAYDSEIYQSFLGDYRSDGDELHHFTRAEDGSFQWRFHESDPVTMLPAGPALFVSDDNRMSLEFLPSDSGHYDRVELRKERYRRIHEAVPTEILATSALH